MHIILKVKLFTIVNIKYLKSHIIDKFEEKIDSYYIYLDFDLFESILA